MTLCTFFVPGTPAPGGSKRHIGGGRIIDASKRSGPWRSVVALAGRDAYRGDPHTGTLSVEVTFTMPRPRSHFRTGKHASELKPNAPTYHTVAPDATKLWRSTEDALTGIVWKDDSQIAVQRVSKVYGDKPGAHVRVEVMECG